MSIVLTILKVIGITLLILLALVLFLASLVLFVPVRYQLQLCMDKDVEARVTISYLLHFIHLAVGYHDNNPNGKLRILGIPVYDFFPTEEQKKKREEREKQKQEKRKQKLHKQKEKQRKKSAKLNQKKKEATIKPKDLGKNTSDKQNSINKSPQISESKCQKLTTSAADGEDDKGKNPGVLQKLKDIFWKLKLFFQKAVDKVKNLKYTIIGFCSKLKYARETILWYVEVLNREESVRAIKKAKCQIGRLFRHIRPKQFRGYFRFGFEDPATTGDIFSKICMLYPLYANNIVIIPDFENRVFKGELFMKGRIQVATLLHIGWKIMFDKDIRNLYEICTGQQKQ